jgi:microcystin-dependent protein
MEAYIASIMPVAFPTPPKGWAQCNGQTLAIQQNQALFALIGTYFGGNGTTNFQLPDLRGRTPIGLKQNTNPGAKNGTESVTLTLNQVPSHTHLINATSANGSGNKPVPPADKIFATQTSLGTGFSFFTPPQTPVTLGQQNVVPAGGSAPHNNMQPFLTVNYLICQYGIYPSHN